MKNTGIILIVVGALMMIYTGFNYVTEKRVVDLGPLKVNKEQNHTVSWPPIVGGVILVAGIALLLTGRKKAG